MINAVLRRIFNFILSLALKRVGTSPTFIPQHSSLSYKRCRGRSGIRLGLYRFYSTKVQCKNTFNNIPDLKNVLRYENADESKLKILVDNKGKSGIYM